MYRRTRRSSRRRRDGTYRDLLKNSTRALDKGVRVASRAPNDAVRKLNSKRLWRAGRPLVRTFTTPWLGLFR